MHLNRTVPRCGFALAVGAILAVQGLAAENFRKLKDAEIRARLAGMETTDGVHWAEQYMHDGTFKMFDMGKVTLGKWFVRNGMLCLDDGKSDLVPLSGARRSGCRASRSNSEYQIRACRHSTGSFKSSSRGNERRAEPW